MLILDHLITLLLFHTQRCQEYKDHAHLTQTLCQQQTMAGVRVCSPGMGLIREKTTPLWFLNNYRAWCVQTFSGCGVTHCPLPRAVQNTQSIFAGPEFPWAHNPWQFQSSESTAISELTIHSNSSAQNSGQFELRIQDNSRAHNSWQFQNSESMAIPEPRIQDNSRALNP